MWGSSRRHRQPAGIGGWLAVGEGPRTWVENMATASRATASVAS